MSLRSDQQLQENNDFSEDFFQPGSIVAVAASEQSFDTVWFIKVTEHTEISEENICCVKWTSIL